MTERMPSTEANKAVARRLFDEVLNQHNPARIDELCAPNYVARIMPAELPADREGAKQFLSHYFSAFPDLQFTIEDMIAEGDRVVVRFTGAGTHHNDLQGLAPTDRKSVV